MEFILRELGVPIIYQEREVGVREVFHMRVYEVYSFIHLVPTTYHVQLVIVCLYKSRRFTMESPRGASNNVLEPRSNNWCWAKVKNEASVVSNPTLVRENVRVDTFDSSRSVHSVYGHDSISECWRNMCSCATQTLLAEVKVELPKMFCHPPGIYVLIKFSK